MKNVYFCKTGCREKITGVYFRKNELTKKSFRVYFSRAVQDFVTFVRKVYILVARFKRKVYICDRNFNGKVYASKKDPV